MNFNWLNDLLEQRYAQLEMGQLPHALLIQGPAGTGRRYLALSLALRILAQPAPDPRSAMQPGLPLNADELPAHPDLMLVQPPPDKRSIPIDRIREMIGFLQLTAHQGGAKVALISPADSLSHAAANSLLKTLEEPPAGCHLLLVTESLTRLPATLISRCQILRVALPTRAEAEAWQGEAGSAADWKMALALAGGAPLLAASLQAKDFVAEAGRLEADLAGLERGQVSALLIARRWARLDQAACLDWLYRRSANKLRAELQTSAKTATKHLQNDPEGLNMEPFFTYLREIGELRRLLGSGLNIELNLARLLGQWQRAHAQLTG